MKLTYTINAGNNAMPNPTQNAVQDGYDMLAKQQRHNKQVKDLLDKVRDYIDARDIQKAQMYADAAALMIAIFNQPTSTAVTTF
tara:strand:- start:153 stop:404 length:252 start_codon:yes stop_codon:yes gene_type:complete